MQTQMTSPLPMTRSSNIQSKFRRLGVKGVITEIIKYAILLILAASFVLPFFWMVTSALKNDPQVFTIPPIWFPNPAHWGNFWAAWHVRPFTAFAINTIIRYAVPVTLGTVISSSVVAYGFSRIKWPGRDVLFFICIMTMMVPFFVLMVPLFIIFKNLGWINTYLPLVVPAFFGNAFNIFLLRQFFLTIPEELADAARIDGCSEFDIFWRIILPLAKPALAVVALFAFIGAWNDYLGPLIYINKVSMFPVALGISELNRAVSDTGAVANMYPYLMAASTIITLPIVIFFFFAQRTFIEGITLTGMKG
jgi:ABC-type glycerol-3-phosphate transport system permease component